MIRHVSFHDLIIAATTCSYYIHCTDTGQRERRGKEDINYKELAYGDWPVRNLQCGPAGWSPKRNNGAVPDQRPVGKDPGEPMVQMKLVSWRGQSFCCFQAFTWLDETHLHYREQSALSKVH